MNKECLENVTFDEITIGLQASLNRTLTQEDITLFATMSGDVNPAHMDEAFAFSGGIGEHSTVVRDKILQHLALFRPFATRIVPANEERMMAMHSISLLNWAESLYKSCVSDLIYFFSR